MLIGNSLFDRGHIVSRLLLRGEQVRHDRFVIGAGLGIRSLAPGGLNEQSRVQPDVTGACACERKDDGHEERKRPPAARRWKERRWLHDGPAGRRFGIHPNFLVSLFAPRNWRFGDRHA
ncbi:hypothetical protein XH89_29830 [Bradyrhizobium sp. CCBAU 53340]|nr:hypothetical protein XH89_29830 [Bradyrhizobium sp. CCBAU 53340]